MPVNNYRKVKQVLWIILFANLVVAVLKILVGGIINSTSMTADGFHSLTDGSSNIVGLIGIAFASKPVDEDHPYGHSKYETLTGLFIGGMLFFIGGKIIFDAFSRFSNPAAVDVTFESIIALVATLIINIIVSASEYRAGKKLNSLILISDSLHTKSDIYVSLGVLLTLIGIKAGLPSIIDSVASLVVSVFILHAAYEIFKAATGILVDTAMLNPEKVREIAMSFENVMDVHHIRSRGNENEVHIDMHVMTDPGMSVEESHTLIHRVEDKIKSEMNKNMHVVIHIEPFHAGDSRECKKKANNIQGEAF